MLLNLSVKIGNGVSNTAGPLTAFASFQKIVTNLFPVTWPRRVSRSGPCSQWRPSSTECSASACSGRVFMLSLHLIKSWDRGSSVSRASWIKVSQRGATLCREFESRSRHKVIGHRDSVKISSPWKIQAVPSVGQNTVISTLFGRYK